MESARAAGDRTSPSAACAASAAGAGSGPECATASFSAPRMRSALCPAPACRGSRGACGSSTPCERGSEAAWALPRRTALLQILPAVDFLKSSTPGGGGAAASSDQPAAWALSQIAEPHQVLPGCYELHDAVCRIGQLDALPVLLRLRALLLHSRKQHVSFSRASSGYRCRGCAKRSSRMPHACALGVLGARPPGCSGCSSGVRVALA
jgi:hypothetical protein